MKTFKYVACEPIPKHAVEAVPNASGFMVSEAHVTLVGTRAVARNDTLGVQVGDMVYILGTNVKQKWAINVFKAADREFILVPEGEVVAIDSGREP
jgi:co-chaperonin GroES (HSP10)